jgi:SAM-dependent methyltransferase
MNSKRSKNDPSSNYRGERLYPRRNSRGYWILTQLREEYTQIAKEYVARLPKDRTRLVDFGAGNAPYYPLFAPYVSEYLRCDLAGNPMADCLLECPDLLPLTEGSVNLVLSSQVLEHSMNPARYLAECARVLAEDGLLMLSTHGVWRYHPDPVDLWRWTSSGLRRIVEQSGFEILRFRGILGPSAYGMQIWQDAVLGRLHGRLHPLFSLIMQSWIQLADRRCPPEIRDVDASVFTVVGRKKGDAWPRSDGT